VGPLAGKGLCNEREGRDLYGAGRDDGKKIVFPELIPLIVGAKRGASGRKNPLLRSMDLLSQGGGNDLSQ